VVPAHLEVSSEPFSDEGKPACTHAGLQVLVGGLFLLHRRARERQSSLGVVLVGDVAGRCVAFSRGAFVLKGPSERIWTAKATAIA